MKIIEKPLDLAQLRTLSKDGKERVAAVVPMEWHWLPGRDGTAIEEDLCRRVTGCRYGLDAVDVRLVGVLDQDLLLEVSGDVSQLLENYDEWLAEEARGVGDVW